MPTLAAAAAVSAIGVAQTGITLAAVAKSAILIGSMAYAENRQRKARRAADAMARAGRGFDIRQTDTPRSLIVGRTSVSPERIVHMVVHGDNNEYVSFIACFGAHEIDAVEAILLNNEPIGPTDEDGWVTDPDSKFAKTEYRLKGEEFIWPSPGGTIELSTVNIDGKPLSLGLFEGDQFWPLDEGVHYGRTDTVLPGGTVTTLTALSGSSAYAGRWVVGTFRTKLVEPLVRAKVYLGIEAGERDLFFENEVPDSGWTANHLLKGTPHISFTLKWDSDVFGPTGFPDMRFIVRGAKCWDFVNETTSWTNNSARIAAWFLSRPEGFGVSLSEINKPLAIAAQNACDESVQYGPEGNDSQARYTADGQLNPEESPLDNMRMILGSMAGDAAWVGGEWDLYAGLAQAPVYTLTDDDLAGGPEEFVADAANDEWFNSVRGRYFGPESEGSSVYVAKDAPPYSSSTYVSADGGTRSWLEVDLPLTTDVWRAQRIQRLMLHRARNAAVWRTTYNMGAYPVRAGQWVRCKHTEYSWDELDSGRGKLFQVRERRMLPSGDIELAMVETAASIFSWNYDEAIEPDPTPNKTFPDPTYVEPLRGLEIRSDADTYDEGTDGQKIPYVLLTWDAFPPAIAAEAKRIEIEWKAASEVGYQKIIVEPDQTSLKLRPVWGGMLISGSARAMSVLGVRSEPLFFEHRASMDLPGNQQAVSANLLTNPTFKSGVKGWVFGIEAGATDNIYFRKPVQAIIPGTPTQVRIEQAGTENKYAVLSSDLISVIPGRRYCGYAECLGSYARTRVQCTFYDAANQNINHLLPPGTPNIGNMIAPALAGTSPADPSRYSVSEFFVDAPPNAASARFTLVKFGTISHTASWGDFYRPFFGEVPSGSTQRPPWDPGGLPSIDTSALEDNAATDIYAPTVADFATSLGGVGPPGPVPHPIYSFTPAFSGDIEVSISGEVRAEALSAEPVVVTGWLGGNNWIVKSGQPSPQSTEMTLLSVPGNDTAIGPMSMVMTFGVTAGQQVTIALWVKKGGRPNSVSATPPGGVVPKPVNTGDPVNINIRGISARITHVKR